MKKSVLFGVMLLMAGCSTLTPSAADTPAPTPARPAGCVTVEVTDRGVMVRSTPEHAQLGVSGRVRMNGEITGYGTVLIATGNDNSVQAIHVNKAPGLSIEVSCTRQEEDFVQVYPQ